MHVLILHNAVDAGSAVEDRDVLVQRDVVRQALQSAGHQATSLPCTLDLSATQNYLRDHRPEVAFNLVETLGGSDRLMPLMTLLLESMDIPYTGAPSPAMLRSIGKLTGKRHLQSAGLPTPPWISSDHVPRLAPVSGQRWIVKPVWEHASFGMDDNSVLTVEDAQALLRAIQRKARETGRTHFAEAFVEGRELNLSLLEQDDGQPLVLPPAEIDFSRFPVGKPRIVGHSAKWDEQSVEYQGTPRKFDFAAQDAALLTRLTQLARECWTLFGLRGYARVDFRVDEQGQPWILELNVNPCLAPDAGYAAALTQGGYEFRDAVRLILEAALRPGNEGTP